MNKTKVVKNNLTFYIYTFLLSVTIYFIASFFPEARLWAFNSYGYLPWYMPLIYLSVCIIIVLPLLLKRSDFNTSLNGKEHTEKHFLFPVISFSLIILSGILFYIFKAETHYLGDGYQLISWIYEGIHFKPWEKGSFFLQHNFYLIIGDLTKEGARFSLQLFSIISGVCFLIISSLFARSLFISSKDRLLFLLGIGTGGYMMLYFGYIESYPSFVLSILIFTYTGLMVAQERINRWFILLPLLLCGSLHIFAVSLLPATLYLLISKNSVGNYINSQSSKNKYIISLFTLIVITTVFLLVYSNSYFFRFTIVPFVNDRFTVAQYTMFSAKHMLDVVNLLFILVPALIILIPLIITGIKNRLFIHSDYRFLAILTLSTVGIGAIFNPGLGMPRDWDLFSFLGVPMTIFLFYIILEDKMKLRGKVSIALLAITLGILSLGGRVAVQSNKERSIQLLDNLADLDNQRCRNALYFLNEQLLLEGDMVAYEERKRSNTIRSPQENWLIHGLSLAKEGREQEAFQLFKKAVEYDPAFFNGWGNMALSFISFNMLDSAKFCLEITAALNPFSAGVKSNEGWIAYIEGDYQLAEKKLREAINLKESKHTARLRLLTLFEKQKRQREYDSLLWETSDRSDAPTNIIYMAATRADSLQHREKAAKYFIRLLNSGVDSSMSKMILEKYPEIKPSN